VEYKKSWSHRRWKYNRGYQRLGRVTGRKGWGKVDQWVLSYN
jgi:hypothetical protein